MQEIKQTLRTDLKKLSDSFKKNKYVQIPNYLEFECAKSIHHCLSQQTQWNLAWNNMGEHTDMDYESVKRWTLEQQKQLSDRIHSQAGRSFQYRYAAIPIYDIYHKKLLPGHFFNFIYEFFNSTESLDFAKSITNIDSIKFADIQATRYSKGHFLTEHDDHVKGKNRLAAYVLNLTPEWKNDWGGALLIHKDEVSCHALFPKFNALNIFAVPQKHSVSYISPFAQADRYSITGWFRY